VATGGQLIFTRDDLSLIAAFAGCSLDESPGSNWVQEAGGLPEYICQIARAIKRTGKTTSRAIAIAVSRVKKWATGVGVDADTQAKSVAALAEWEAKRAKTAAKQRVKASRVDPDILVLANEYNVDSVRTAFECQQREIRQAWYTANPNGGYESAPERLRVKELWNTFLVAQQGWDDGAKLYKVPYTVDGTGTAAFGDAVEVAHQYVVVPQGEVDDTGLSDDAIHALMATVPAGPSSSFLGLSSTGSALARVLAYAKQAGTTTSEE
jgi:hypothetical protein